MAIFSSASIVSSPTVNSPFPSTQYIMSLRGALCGFSSCPGSRHHQRDPHLGLRKHFPRYPVGMEFDVFFQVRNFSHFQISLHIFELMLLPGYRASSNISCGFPALFHLSEMCAITAVDNHALPLFKNRSPKPGDRSCKANRRRLTRVGLRWWDQRVRSHPMHIFYHHRQSDMTNTIRNTRTRFM